MARKILLIEPNYKNKYPPMGLMKLATYHKLIGDHVTFYKGEFSDFILDLLFDEFTQLVSELDGKIDWREHKALIQRFIQRGRTDDLDRIERLCGCDETISELRRIRSDFYHKKYYDNPLWDRVCITSLFTFHWKILIKAINDFKWLCKDFDQVQVGGIAASILPKEIEDATGVKPHVGLLDKPGMLDDNKIIIDHLPLDYSILHEIDYKYPENNGYYGYTTRGCPNKCKFCAVPTLEPEYQNYIGLKKQIEYVDAKFGPKRNLLLLDNNVLASNKFYQIIDEIKDCGFAKGSKYIPPNEYEYAYQGLISGYNDAGYTKQITRLYHALLDTLSPESKHDITSALAQNKLLHTDTATKEGILAVHDLIKPHFDKRYTKRQLARYVDFNQGIDARKLTEEKIKKLTEISIRPLRIAFDSIKYRKIYEKAVRTSAKHGIKSMSNYLLYNFEDTPIELYERLKLNVELCEELRVDIYSFPMKYHPINDPEYFSNRNFIGKHWNKKYIRAVQAVLNATKGKIGRGLSFFKEAFGTTPEDYFKILLMPEPFIIYRFYYQDSGHTDAWWEAYQKLNSKQKDRIHKIIYECNFDKIKKETDDPDINAVLEFYKITRNTPRL